MNQNKIIFLELRDMGDIYEILRLLILFPEIGQLKVNKNKDMCHTSDKILVKQITVKNMLQA